MPPVQATSRPFSDNCHSTLIFTYLILSLSFIFILLFICWSTIRRHHPKHGNAHAAHLSATFSPPHLLSNEEWKAKRVSTVSTLSTQSTIASNPLHLNVISEIGPSPSRGRIISLLSRLLAGLRLLRKGRASSLFFQQPPGSNGKEQAARPKRRLRELRLLRKGRASSLFIQQPPGEEEASRPGQHLRDLRLLRKSRASSLFFQQPNGSIEKEQAARPEQHLHDRIEPVADADDDEPERDIRTDIHSTDDAFDDAQLKIEAPIPFIILSLPSGEHLIVDPPTSVSPVSLDENLLSPDGTFRSTGWAADDTHDFIDTLPIIASRLRERRKGRISFPSTNILSSPDSMAYWPRWF